MPLLIAVAIGLVVFVLRRALGTRRLTIEQSVDRHRRTLSAVHDAASGSRSVEGPTGAPTSYTPAPKRSRREFGARSRWWLAVAVMVVASVATFAILIAGNRGDDDPKKTAAPTTTRPPATAATTTTRALPPTTVPLVTATSATAFTVGRPNYNLVVDVNTGQCWIDARDPKGKTLFSGTLSAGQSQSIAAGTVTLRLGNPAAVALKIEDVPVPLALPDGSPVTLQFTAA